MNWLYCFYFHTKHSLCGRGGNINSHPGNIVFRGWIAKRRESYNLADSKADKSRITAEIMQQVQELSPPGRFLQKFDDSPRGRYTVNGHWTEIDDLKALAKISQALREGAPAFRALHGKKGRKKHQQSKQSKPPERTSTRRTQKRKGSSRHNRKAPPALVSTSAGMKKEVLESMPPLPPLDDAAHHELDVLFPTSNNFFATSQE